MKTKEKGQFFSIITILMVLPLVVLSVSFGETMGGYGTDVGEQVRLKSGYYYYRSMEEDLERVSQKVGHRAVLSAISYTVETGQGLGSSQEVLEELFVDGSINGESHPLMNRSGIDGWVDSIGDVSSERGYNVDLERQRPDIDMYDPFTISFSFDYSLTMEDSGGLFSISKEDSRPNTVSIDGIEDPIVVLGTGGRYSTTFRRCGFDSAVEEIDHGTGNNSWGHGITVVRPQGICGVDNSGDRVAVVEDATEEVDCLNEFSAVVAGTAEDDHIDVPYVSGVDIDGVPNSTRVVVDGYRGEVWDIENLYMMWSETCYIPGTDSPSFMDRLENNLSSSSSYGLNVLINKGDLQREGLDVKDRSNLAHIYFSEEDVIDCRVKGMPESFRIDPDGSKDIGLDSSLQFDCQ